MDHQNHWIAHLPPASHALPRVLGMVILKSAIIPISWNQTLETGKKRSLLSLRGGPDFESGQSAQYTSGSPITLFDARLTIETFFVTLCQHNKNSVTTSKGCSKPPTHGISGVMASNEVNVEWHDIAGLHGVDIVHVVLILISSAQVGVAFIVRVRGAYGVLDRAGEICSSCISTPSNLNIFYDMSWDLPFFKTAVTRAPQSSTCLGPV
jgi:hypothetical protein